MTSFLASIPLTATAIRIHGEGGLRLTLDVPESSLPEALALIGMRGETLRVTVKIVPKAYTPAPDDDALPFDEGNAYPYVPANGQPL